MTDQNPNHTNTAISCAVVVPTVRGDSIQPFLEAWRDELAEATILLIEDNPKRTFQVEDTNVRHFCWADIDDDLGGRAWIIPRRTDCIRSYGYWKAWQAGADTIITLDDDCFPSEPDFMARHQRALYEPARSEAWTTSLDGIQPRGVPYEHTARERPVLVNHGLWRGVPDVDALTQLMVSRSGAPAFDLPQQTIPTGQYFPMCGMNLAFRREAAPAMYFLLMGQEHGYDRFGDIWAGVFIKRIADHLGYLVTSGSPAIEHKRASNVWNNLAKEAPGLPVNETLWDRIDRQILTATTIADCYQQLADAIEAPEGYFATLREAMHGWLELFQIDEPTAAEPKVEQTTASG